MVKGLSEQGNQRIVLTKKTISLCGAGLAAKFGMDEWQCRSVGGGRMGWGWVVVVVVEIEVVV